jgi:hypothetical protein
VSFCLRYPSCKPHAPCCVDICGLSGYTIRLFFPHYLINGTIFGGGGCRVNERKISFYSHCATSRKVAGLIPDGVIGIFHWYKPSGRTMALGSTQTLIEMSNR